MTQDNNTSSSPRVWIVLVNWNGWRDTLECLESVLRQDYDNYRIVVCDNDSSDGSIEKIISWATGELIYTPPDSPLGCLTTPPLQKPVEHALLESIEGGGAIDDFVDYPLLLVRTGGNLGFAGGNNVGMRLALQDSSCRYVWLLNNDTVINRDTLNQMVIAAGRSSDIGITGSINCFYSAPEIVQALGGGWFNRWKAWGGLHGNGSKLSEICPTVVDEARARLDWISGASMLVSRNFIERTGEMEEQYFLYFEEIDWGIRSRPRFVNEIASGAILYHKAGSTTDQSLVSDFSLQTLYLSRFKLYRKLLPRFVAICYARALIDLFVACLRGRPRIARAILKAVSIDLAMPAPFERLN